MDQEPPHDQHAHRNLDVPEEPLDAANQSLADALRASFSILKGIMMVLVVLYLFSNVKRVDSHEQALVLRLGALQAGVREPGLRWAFPFPIDEFVTLPTKKSNDLLIRSHTFHRRKDEEGKPLKFLVRGTSSGLDPSLDGALVTADAGLVHTQWKITYKIRDVSRFVTNFRGDTVESAADLVRTLVETVGIHVASEMTAEEIIRTRVDAVQREIRHRLNDRLEKLNSGIIVTLVEMFEPTPPLQIRGAFDATQRAENDKKTKIDEARREETRILSRAAGAVYKELVEVLDALEAGGTEDRSIEDLQAELDCMLTEKVEGEAGRLIREASAYHAVVVGRMQSDVDLYRTLLPEYERNPDLLIARLWEQTKGEIFDQPGVTKFFRPPGAEIRIHIPLDEEQTRLEEQRRLQEQSFDAGGLRPGRKKVPLGPEAD